MRVGMFSTRGRFCKLDAVDARSFNPMLGAASAMYLQCLGIESRIEGYR